MSDRSASNNQLYVLNKHGRLQLLPVGTKQTPVTSGEADAAIKQGLAADPKTSADEGHSA